MNSEPNNGIRVQVPEARSRVVRYISAPQVCPPEAGGLRGGVARQVEGHRGDAGPGVVHLFVQRFIV